MMSQKVCIVHETGDGRLGGHGTQFAFDGLPGVEIAALADGNPEANEAWRRTGARRLYHDWREMLERERPDITVLCSRLVADHALQIRFALEHGSHVLCEKPLAAELREADALVRLARRTGRLVQIAHLARFAPAFQEMKRLLTEGALGRVLECRMRGKEDDRGGGEDMLVLGTHLLDAACWLFGRPQEVFADIRQEGRPIVATDTLPTAEPVGPCAGDEVFARFRFASGVPGVFESRRGLVPRAKAMRMGIWVFGTGGALAIRYEGERELRLSHAFPAPPEDEAVFEPVPLPPVPEIPGAEPIPWRRWEVDPAVPAKRYFAENNRRAAWNLLQAITRGVPLVAGIESALDSLEMISGAYASALTRRPVPLPLRRRRHPLHPVD